MEIGRRSVLNSIVAAGVVHFPMSQSFAFLSGPSDDEGARTTRRRTVALIDDAVKQSNFLEGVAAAPTGINAEIVRADFSMGFVQELKQMLRCGPMQIIGLVDDGAGAFIIQMTRAAGSRIHWLAQHAAHDGVVRHSAIGAATQRFVSRASFANAQSWPGNLGFAMASLGAAGTRTADPEFLPKRTSLVGSFVSFLIVS